MGTEEERWQRCITTMHSRYSVTFGEMPNGEKRLAQFKKFVRIPDVSSILVVPKEGGYSFVLINWGTPMAKLMGPLPLHALLKRLSSQ